MVALLYVLIIIHMAVCALCLLFVVAWLCLICDCGISWSYSLVWGRGSLLIFRVIC